MLATSRYPEQPVALQPIQYKAGGYEDIPVVSFPYCHVCSKSSCGLLFDMREHLNLEDYREKQGQVRCPQCGFPAYPARFIVMCGDGHMDDFPEQLKLLKILFLAFLH